MIVTTIRKRKRTAPNIIRWEVKYSSCYEELDSSLKIGAAKNNSLSKKLSLFYHVKLLYIVEIGPFDRKRSF